MQVVPTCLWLRFKFFLSGHAMLCAGAEFPDQGSNPCPCILGAWGLGHWTSRDG